MATRIPGITGPIPTAGGTPVHPSLLAKSGIATAGPPPAHFPLAQITRRPVQPTSACQTPDRFILRGEDVAPWLQSEAFVRIMWFIMAVNAACANLTCSQAKLLLTTHAPTEAQERVQRVLDTIATLDRWVEEVPPEPLARGRFGNKAFRTYQARLTDKVGELMDLLLAGFHGVPLDGEEEAASPPLLAKDELAAYLLDAFGNATRIDYGSGHELAFVFFLGGLELLGFFGRDVRTAEQHDRTVLAALGLVVMPKYLDLVRKLQRTYSLEPAGSHGVWGLDDFQFLPYLWGSAQLLDHKHIKPSVVTDKEQVSHFAKEYLYLSCIHYIHETKQGPFFEHSPMLFDISGVQFWSKVNGGMTKMFVAEVMSKFPIVQHIKFGSLFPFRRIDAQE